MTRATFILLAISILYYVTTVSGDGDITIVFVEYVNPKGREAEGSYCDGKWGVRTSDCDHYFVICLDEIASPNTTEPCRLNKTETLAYKDQNKIEFGKDVGGLKNPMVWHLRPMKTSLSLKVAVYDKDSSKDDWVDFLRLDLGKRPGDIGLGRWYTFNMTHRTALEVRVRLDCSRDWYGRQCEVRCTPPERGEHYRCDKQTGKRLCEPGWGGARCSETASTCRSLVCENGGTCVMANRQEVCRCTPEFSGRRCDLDKCREWCRPGSCQRWSLGKDGFRCKCPGGYEEHKPSGSISQCRRVQTGPRPEQPERPRPRPEGPRPRPRPGGKINVNCDTLADNGFRYKDGVYELEPGQARFKTYCDMSESGRGWTEIMQRAGTYLDFNKDWKAYKTGFGDPGDETDYWIGLENMHQLTKDRPHVLVVQMQIGNGDWLYAKYDSFWVDSELKDYMLHVEGYSGTAGDALGMTGPGDDPGRGHNNMRFSTFDYDHDMWRGGECARDFKAGWWYNSCYSTNLNGKYVRPSTRWPRCDRGKCINWRTIKGYENFSLLKASMKVLPKH